MIQEEQNDLSLKDYKQIWTKFCFLDESGSLSAKQQPLFTVGILKLTQPYYLYNKIQYERSVKHFYDEMKFNLLGKKNIDFAKFVIESVLETRSLAFYSYSLDKEGEYFKRTFGADPWQAYEDISLRLLDSALVQNEILILIADHITTPKNIRYEVSVKKRMNDKHRRLALAGVCRFDSKGNDLLQVSDLLIGIVNYDLKMQYGLIEQPSKYKKELVDFFKQQLGVKNFCEGFRNRSFNIFVDKDSKSRKCQVTNQE
jgi:hypothetical protein